MNTVGLSTEPWQRWGNATHGDRRVDPRARVATLCWRVLGPRGGVAEIVTDDGVRLLGLCLVALSCVTLVRGTLLGVPPLLYCILHKPYMLLGEPQVDGQRQGTPPAAAQNDTYKRDGGRCDSKRSANAAASTAVPSVAAAAALSIRGHVSGEATGGWAADGTGQPMGTSRGSSHHVFSMYGHASSTPRDTGRGEPSAAPTLPPRRSCRGQTTGVAPLPTGEAALPTCHAGRAPHGRCEEGVAAAGDPQMGRSTWPAPRRWRPPPRRRRPLRRQHPPRSPSGH